MILGLVLNVVAHFSSSSSADLLEWENTCVFWRGNTHRWFPALWGCSLPLQRPRAEWSVCSKTHHVSCSLVAQVHLNFNSFYLKTVIQGPLLNGLNFVSFVQCKVNRSFFLAQQQLSLSAYLQATRLTVMSQNKATSLPP